MNMIKKFAFAFAALALATGAQAYPGNSTKQSVNETFTEAGASAGLLSFTLNGYGSLDGANGYEDDFTLSLNGVQIFDGTFNLGGGGSNLIYSQPVGTSVTGLNTTTALTWAGGALDFIVPVALVSGDNTFVFKYTSVKGGFQNVGDESWDVQNVNVTAVPEPTSVALLLAGLGIVGGLARRRAARQA